MKKLMTFGLSLILCIGLLAGCGANYEAAESTVFVLKNGKVVSTDVEEFNEDTYSKEELEEYINNAISAYTGENGEDSIKLKKVSIEDGKATLTIEYASVGDYVAFTGTELFTGSVAETLAAGYSFDGDFASINDSDVAECDAKDFMDQDGLKVAVIKGNVNVKVTGNILYASAANTKLVDKKTIGIAEGNNLLNKKEEASTESATEETTENSTQQDTETTESTEDQVEDSGSVSEDEIMEMEPESESEVSFEFKEEESNDTSSANEQVYTYIIYK